MQTGNAKRLMIFIAETDKWQGHSLGEAIVNRLRKEHGAGATVLRGMEGFGVHGQVHTTGIMDLSASLPLVVIVIDESETIDRMLPAIEEMVAEGLIVVDDVQAIRKDKKR